MAKKKAAKSKPAKKPKAGNKSVAATQTAAPPKDAGQVSGDGGENSAKNSGDSSTADPDVAAAEAGDRAVLEVLAKHHVVITRQQYKLLADASLRQVNAWVATVTNSNGDHIPPLPPCLMDYLTPARRAELHPPKERNLPPRKFMACKFGKASVGDHTFSIPVKVDSAKLSPDEAHQILNGRRLDMLMAIGSSSPDEKKLFDNEQSIKSTVTINGCTMRPKYWAFNIALPSKEVNPDDAFDFANRSGRIELEVLGDAEAGDTPPDKRKLTDPPHPDVEAGKDRPHGTPFLDAAAKAKAEKDQANASPAPTEEPPAPAEDFAEGLDDAPATIPMPAPSGDKLYLCLPQLSASLRLAGIDTVPIADRYVEWSDETKDEVDTFAKVVASHVAGDTEVFLPEIPDALREFLPAEYIDNPVKFAKSHGGKTTLQWHCGLCDEQFAASKARRCPSCDASDARDVILIGFYGDPNVTFDGVYIGPEVAEYQVLQEASYQECSVRVIKGADEKWRAAMFYNLIPETGDKDCSNAFPSVFDAGHVSMHAAIESAIGRLIDRWQPLPDRRFENAVSALKEYLGRIINGQDPLAIEQSIPDAEVFDPGIASDQVAEEDDDGPSDEELDELDGDDFDDDDGE